MMKPIELSKVRKARKNLDRIAANHPELIDSETPWEILEQQWEETLKGALMEEKVTYTIEEAAALLSCHKDTVRRAIKAGKLKAAKWGKEYRISRADIEQFYRDKGGGSLFGS